MEDVYFDSERESEDESDELEKSEDAFAIVPDALVEA